MKKFAGALGNLVLAALVAAIFYGGYLVVRTNALAKDAAEYTDKAIRAVTDPWSADEFVKRAAPELLRQVGPQFMPKLFAWYAGLGKLKSLDRPAGRVGSGAYPGTSIRGAWAAYSAHAEFDAGPAEITLTLKRQGEGWQIANIQISAQAFSQMKQSPSPTDAQRPLVNGQ